VGLFSREKINIFIIVRLGELGRYKGSCNPTVLVSPTSGQQGTTFYYSGSKYTPNGIVEWHVRKPDGVDYPVSDLSGKVDGSGNFNHNYVSSCGNLVGDYTIYSLDFAR
jgi:hypothetical protein